MNTFRRIMNTMKNTANTMRGYFLHFFEKGYVRVHVVWGFLLRWIYQIEPGALHQAVRDKDLAAVRLLINHGAALEGRDDQYNTPLHIAAREGDVAVMQFLIERGANKEVYNRDHSMPLHLAILQKNLTVVQSLLDSGADVNARSYNNTPLHWAAREGELAMVRLLIDRGADIKARNSHGTPLDWAASRGHLAVVQCLVEKEKDLMSHPIGMSSGNSLGVSPLYLAAAWGHLEVVQWLVEQGASIANVEAHNIFPLHIAVAGGHLAVVQYLIEHGANIVGYDEHHETPLHVVAAAEQYLFKYRSHLNAYEKEGEPPLDVTAKGKHYEIAQYLVEQGADIASRTGNEVTPLHYAARMGSLPIVQCLVERGAEINARDRFGNTPLHDAARSRGDNPMVVRYLVEHGAEIGAYSQLNETPLHLAARYGALAIVQYLVGQGANVNVLDHQNNSPIVLAFEGGHHHVVRYLQQRGAVLPAHLIAEEAAVNENQSVHAVTVHVGVAQAAAALKAQYKNSAIEKAIIELSAYVEALPSASVPDMKHPHEAAKRCLPRLLGMDFTEGRSGITLREAIALVWIGLNDPIEKAHRQAERGFTEAEQKLNSEAQQGLVEKREMELLLEVIPQWLYEIQRGYNLSKTGIDNGTPDMLTCVSGSFNKTIYALNRRHSLVNIDYVSEKTINAKAVTLANAIFDKLSTEDRQRYAEESREGMSPAFVALLRQALPPLLHAEFDSFKSEGLNVDKAIDDIMGSVEYISIKKLTTMVEKLEEEKLSPEPIVTAYSSLSANLPSSSGEAANEEALRTTMNRP